MRKLIISCNITVDGFMAGPGGGSPPSIPKMLSSLDFIVDDPEQENDLAARFEEVADTIVFGRKTYVVMQDAWSPLDSRMAAWINGATKVVLSKNPEFDVSIWTNATLAAGAGVEGVLGWGAGDVRRRADHPSDGQRRTGRRILAQDQPGRHGSGQFDVRRAERAAKPKADRRQGLPLRDDRRHLYDVIMTWR
jgi:hypothetical protein